METECYPCIPMRSASNQHNSSSSKISRISNKNNRRGNSRPSNSSRSRSSLKRTASHLHQLDLVSQPKTTVLKNPMYYKMDHASHFC